MCLLQALSGIKPILHLLIVSVDVKSASLMALMKLMKSTCLVEDGAQSKPSAETLIKYKHQKNLGTRKHQRYGAQSPCPVPVKIINFLIVCFRKILSFVLRTFFEQLMFRCAKNQIRLLIRAIFKLGNFGCICMTFYLVRLHDSKLFPALDTQVLTGFPKSMYFHHPRLALLIK